MALTKFEELLQSEACDPGTEGRAERGGRCKRSEKVRILARKGECREKAESCVKQRGGFTGVEFRAREKVDEPVPHVADR